MKFNLPYYIHPTSGALWITVSNDHQSTPEWQAWKNARLERTRKRRHKRFLRRQRERERKAWEKAQSKYRNARHIDEAFDAWKARYYNGGMSQSYYNKMTQHTINTLLGC